MELQYGTAIYPTFYRLFFFKKNLASKDGVLFARKRWLEESEL